MAFLGLMFTPKLYKEYGVGLPTKLYEPANLERWGDKVLSTLNVIWNIGYYTSPLIVTFLYRRGYFVADSITLAGRISTSIGLLVFVSLCIRSLGRSQNATYMRFIRTLEAGSTKTGASAADKELLRRFDFDFKSWPVDFAVKQLGEDQHKRKPVRSAAKSKPFWISSLPCEIAAYVAIHSFGIRMIYPGSMSLIQSYLHPMLVQGRAKLVEEERARRYKLRTVDDNDIDTIFVDNREHPTVASTSAGNGNGNHGRTLVICSEGNAGFYEVGIMTTPMALKYSVLGWNHPGFAGSTGSPYPEQDHNAIDAVMQFAIHELGFLPENILLFGWSIGGYSSIYAATQYPDVRGVILDATFDDVLELALPRMPACLSGIVRIAIRQYVNLNIAELLNAGYAGPVLLIRRTADEVIAEDMNVATNRGNDLLLSMLRYRYPNVFMPAQVQNMWKLLSQDVKRSNDKSDQLCLTLLMSYLSEHGRLFPLHIGEDYSTEQRDQLAEYLLRKHLIDFMSSHCTPLPVEYFQMPWSAPEDDREYVFT